MESLTAAKSPADARGQLTELYRANALGTLGNATGGCVKEEPEFDLHPTTRGKPFRVLYRYRGSCQAAGAVVLWAGTDGTAIGVIAAYPYPGSREHTKITADLLTRGTFKPLRIAPPGISYAPGAIAF